MNSFLAQSVMPIVNWALIAPEVIVCLAAVIVMLVDAFVRPTQRWITGGIAMGGIIASLAIIVRKELLIPIICGIFLVENLSVILQVVYFKRTKAKYGEGRRILLMSPLHHHYQKVGYHESKIATRFWIIGIILAIMSIVTLKLQ